MSFNLLKAANDLITSELVSKASSFLSESESGVHRAFEGILPSLIGGITDKAASTEGSNIITNLAISAHNYKFIDNLSSFFGNENGGSLLNNGARLVSGMLGNTKTTSLTNVISNFAAIKMASASSLLSMAAPLVLGLLGKHAAKNNLNAEGVAASLSGQKKEVIKAIPGGLNVSDIFNVNNTISHAAGVIPPNQQFDGENKTALNTQSTFKWLLPLFLLMLITMFAWYFLAKNKVTDSSIANINDSIRSVREHAADNATNIVSPSIGKVDSLTGDFIYEMGKMVEINLPDGAGVLSVGENSTENKLYKFLINGSRIDTSKGNWFEFRNVRFKTGGIQLDSSSLVQLKNMVAITKAFPTAEFKIGGYTDNTGDSAANVILSQKRAEVVIEQLKKLGASPGAITGAKGYGPNWPIANNLTVEGRAMNRRVAVNVKAK